MVEEFLHIGYGFRAKLAGYFGYVQLDSVAPVASEEVLKLCVAVLFYSVVFELGTVHERASAIEAHEFVRTPSKGHDCRALYDRGEETGNVAFSVPGARLNL